MSRISGIVFGSLISLVVAVFVYPISATGPPFCLAMQCPVNAVIKI